MVIFLYQTDLEGDIMDQNTKRGIVTVTLCYVSWGILVVYWKLLGSVNSYYTLASRIIWSMVFCLLVLGFQGKLKGVHSVLHDRRALLLTMAAGFVVCLNWGSYIVAVQSGYVMESSLGYYINPLITIIVSMICFRERMKIQEWIATGLAALAVMILVIQGGRVPIYALLIGGSFAVYGALKKAANLESTLSLLVETATVFPFALFYIIYAEMTRQGAIGVLDGSKMWLLPLSGIITGAPLLMFGYGVRRIPYSIVGMLMYINPTLQLGLSVFVYKEPFTKTHGITFTLIWIGILVFLHSKWREAKAHVHRA